MQPAIELELRLPPWRREQPNPPPKEGSMSTEDWQKGVDKKLEALSRRVLALQVAVGLVDSDEVEEDAPADDQ